MNNHRFNQQWNPGNNEPESNFKRQLLSQHKTTQCRRLEKEIEELQEKKRNLDRKLEDAAECREMFRCWGGIEIEESTESKFNVSFLAYDNGNIYQKYSIGLHKFGKVWTVAYYNLPYSMKLIPQRIEDAKIDTTAKLSSMIRNLQHEVNLFVRREEQFREAKSLASPNLRLYPSKSTTSLMLEFCVTDSDGSDLSEVCVYLSYHIDKFLPEEPLFKFKGGDSKSQDAFKQQMITLEHMPLKEAINSAFTVGSSDAETSVSKDPSITPASEAEITLLSDSPMAAAPPGKQKLPAKITKQQPVRKDSNRGTSKRGKPKSRK